MKSIPVLYWPEADRTAWSNAMNGSDPFDDRGRGANWSNRTSATVAWYYGRWLRFMADDGPDVLRADPVARLTAANLDRFVGSLKETVAPFSVHIYIEKLYQAARVMFPGSDWRWMRPIITRLANGAHPRDKRPRIVHSRRLFQLGVSLMDTPAPDQARSLDRAILYRDGLLIALLSVIPLRRTNITETEIGPNLVVVGDGFELAFNADQMKSRRPLAHLVPEIFVPRVAYYLTEVRPLFPGAATTNALWLSAKGGALGGQGIYMAIKKRTRAAFGHAVNPHLFRDCAVTSIALERPDQIGRARDLLGHRSTDTLERLYNQACSVDAARLHSEMIREIRAGGPTSGQRS